MRDKCDFNVKRLHIEDEEAGTTSSELSAGGNAGFLEDGFSEQIIVSTNLSHFIHEIESPKEIFNCEGYC